MGALGAPGGMQTGSESPPGGRGGDDKLSGTGPYPSQMWPIDPNFKGHTVYAPKTPPKGVKLPALIWGNGGCSNGGTGFQNFLREIASHGFIVAANGEGGPPGLSQTKMTSMTESLDWIMKGAGGGKYGDVDSSKIAAAGQSCGGLEALSASYHDDRVKTTMVMNSGVFSAGQKALLKELKAPIAYFIGGPKDIAYQNVGRLVGSMSLVRVY
jgi:dienelactone hydrolase